jgi:hypothetical protein
MRGWVLAPFDISGPFWIGEWPFFSLGMDGCGGAQLLCEARPEISCRGAAAGPKFLALGMGGLS